VSQYRDPLAAIREQIATKRARVEDLMERVAPFLWALATPDERDHVRALRGQASSDPEDLAAVTFVDSALDALVASLERITTPMQWFEGEWPDAAPLTDPGIPRHAWLPDDALFALHDDLDVRVSKLLGATRLEMWGTGFRARGYFGRVPVVFKTMPISSDATDFRSSLRLRLAVPCSLTLSPTAVLADALGTTIAGARVRAAIERLAKRGGAAYVLDQEAKIAWTSDDDEQRTDPIPFEAIGALAALYMGSWRVRVP
jgi:hypothetical protein